MIETQQNNCDLDSLLNTMDSLIVSSEQMCQEPNNLFDCQIKIFTKWYKSWTLTEKTEFMKQLHLIDPELVSSINTHLQNNLQLQ